MEGKKCPYCTGGRMMPSHFDHGNIHDHIYKCTGCNTESPLEKMREGKCYCGAPIDMSNPDCVEFSLCEEHSDDA